MDRTTRRRFTTLLAAAAAPVPVWNGLSAREAPPAQVPGRRLQAKLDELRSAAGFPGATAALVFPNDAVFGFASGHADLEDRAAMPPDGRMLSGSTGKSFVAAVALSLAREGVLDLDAPVAEQLGSRPWFGRLPNAANLTARLLLRHRGGLPDHVRDPRFRATMAERMATQGADAFFPPEEAVSFILDRAALAAPDAEFHYSDTGYLLIGLLIEQATGQAYYGELARRLLHPLGLGFTAPATRRRLPGLVAGYIHADDPLGMSALLPHKIARDSVLVYNPATEWTGGGLVTNPRDLALWAKRLYEGKAMAGAYVDELLMRAGPGGTPPVGYGLGVEIRPSALGPAYGHRGWTPGYLSIFAYYPRYGLAAALQINELGAYDMAAFVDGLTQVAVQP